MAFGILGGNAIAQNVTGTLTGTVADPSGAVVPGATVLMKNTASGDERRTVTNNDGFFSINAVQPGDYTVTIKAQGFEAYAQEGVHFDAGDKRNLSNIALKVGSSAETVTVSGTAEELTPVDSGEKSIVIGQKQLENIAIVGQNAAEFIKAATVQTRDISRSSRARARVRWAVSLPTDSALALWILPPTARISSIRVATADKR